MRLRIKTALSAAKTVLDPGKGYALESCAGWHLFPPPCKLLTRPTPLAFDNLPRVKRKF